MPELRRLASGFCLPDLVVLSRQRPRAICIHFHERMTFFLSLFYRDRGMMSECLLRTFGPDCWLVAHRQVSKTACKPAGDTQRRLLHVSPLYVSFIFIYIYSETRLYTSARRDGAMPKLLQFRFIGESKRMRIDI